MSWTLICSFMLKEMAKSHVTVHLLFSGAVYIRIGVSKIPAESIMESLKTCGI